MILYLSGPMTGHYEHNFPAFERAAAKLRSAGYIVINPAENWGGDTTLTRRQCMKLDIAQVLLADGLALLDGWQTSSGALCEVIVAGQIGVQAHNVDHWLEEKAA